MKATRPPPGSGVLTAQQLARHLQVPLSMIRRMTSDGRIPAMRLGHRTVRYDLDEVRAALRTPSASPPRTRQSPPEPTSETPLPHYDWSGGTCSSEQL